MNLQEINNDIFIERALTDNKELFSAKEYRMAFKHIELTRKIYLLGYVNAREIYKN